MKKISKLMVAALLMQALLAVGARAEVSIAMGIDGYQPASSAGEAQRAAQLEALSEAAGRLSDAAAKGDYSAAGSLLAGVYSGSAAAARVDARPVVRRQAAAVPAAKAAPARPASDLRDAPVSRPAVPARAAAARSASEELGAAAGTAAPTPEASAKDDAKKDDAKEDEDKKPPLWQQALAGLIGFGIVCLFMFVLL